MQTTYKKRLSVFFTVIISALLISAGAIMLAPKLKAHADTEETHDHSTMTEYTGELTDGTSYYLTDNIDGNITVTGKVTLCLNGHTITGDGTKSVITVSENAEFTLCDCVGTGIITGGNGQEGGGVRVLSNASFTMTGGTISDNTAGVYGGGVCVASNALFTMTGGTISNNTAVAYGGGVHIYSGTFTITGGSIVGNSVTNSGRCVMVYPDGTVNVSGNPYIEEVSGTTINIIDELTEGAKIGVIERDAVATGFTQNDNPSKYFIPDNPDNCAYLSDETSGTIAIGEHNIIQHEAKEPTCTEKGWEAHEGCSRCDYAIDKVEIEALGHTEVSDDNAVAPTCTETGLTASTHCSVCDTVVQEQTTAEALGHTEVSDDNAVAPTCTETGLTESKHCSVCDTVVQEQTTAEALGHNYGEWTVTKEATETEEGEERRVCANDETHFETRAIPKLTPANQAAPAEQKKSYVWICWLLFPLALAVGGVTLGVWLYKKGKERE